MLERGEGAEGFLCCPSGAASGSQHAQCSLHPELTVPEELHTWHSHRFSPRRLHFCGIVLSVSSFLTFTNGFLRSRKLSTSLVAFCFVDIISSTDFMLSFKCERDGVTLVGRGMEDLDCLHKAAHVSLWLMHLRVL